ncbi:hypothetical protein B0J13DRAFT_519586 [Dactylonectria estremocensis]|uniref:Uncharacterized protein n=1 Tax=Dactylonectria estremocensis TaxID=1079267 RepID=A0A9P9FE88_9HYPO|nr:hypothetical protein B0J13DRAFT_519586 [Dactylonectria estremocensis]
MAYVCVVIFANSLARPYVGGASASPRPRGPDDQRAHTHGTQCNLSWENTGHVQVGSFSHLSSCHHTGLSENLFILSNTACVAGDCWFFAFETFHRLSRPLFPASRHIASLLLYAHVAVRRPGAAAASPTPP